MGFIYKNPNIFLDCYGNPLPDSTLERMLQNALDVEDYKLCQYIKDEQDKRRKQELKTYNY